MSAVECALHLLDLCVAHPEHPGARQARAVLKRYQVRGAALRAEDAARNKAERVASEIRQLLATRRRLLELIGARGGLESKTQPRRKGQVRAQNGGNRCPQDGTLILKRFARPE